MIRNPLMVVSLVLVFSAIGCSGILLAPHSSSAPQPKPQQKPQLHGAAGADIPVQRALAQAPVSASQDAGPGFSAKTAWIFEGIQGAECSTVACKLQYKKELSRAIVQACQKAGGNECRVTDTRTTVTHGKYVEWKVRVIGLFFRRPPRFEIPAGVDECLEMQESGAAGMKVERDLCTFGNRGWYEAGLDQACEWHRTDSAIAVERADEKYCKGLQ